MDKLPTKEDLDKLETSRPIIVFSLDGHIALANSRALAIGGVDASTPDPPGGEIRRGRSGEPTGILLDSAIGLVADKVPPLTAEQNARALAAAYAEMAKQGITSYLEASAGEEELAAMALLSDQGALTVRPSVAVYGDSELATDPAALLAHVEQMRATYGRPDVTIGTVKLFFDGVIEYPTQTAALLQPYRVNKGTKRDPEFVPGKSKGPTYFPPRVAEAAIAMLDAAGWQVHVHAIGDRAVRSALDAFEHARAANGATDNRHTITHLELVHPKDFDRFAKLGVLASMQLQWAERDSYTVDRLKPYIGTQALAQHLSGGQPAPRRGHPVRRVGLAGRPVAAVPPDRDGGQPHGRRGLRGRAGAAVRPRGAEAARIDRDAHAQQRVPAPPGEDQRPDRRGARRRPRGARS